MTADRANTVGFIGLGAMGHHMILARPNSTLPFSMSIAKRWTTSRNVITPAEIAQNASIIISMVPTGKHVREVYLGDNSVMTALNSLSQEERAATLCLDQSTIEQSVSKDVALAMRAVGADMLDAPISGGMTYRGEGCRR
ncbi:hypothetical protein KC342_g16 [Hortaea werneckii]|nr:hypothetical protein KC342_g16 [Hortaea werneckii]